jgi:hypothetical protein
MHGPINVKFPNNISKWQMGFNSAFKELIVAFRNVPNLPNFFLFNDEKLYLDCFVVAYPSFLSVFPLRNTAYVFDDSFHYISIKPTEFRQFMKARSLSLSTSLATRR